MKNLSTTLCVFLCSLALCARADTTPAMIGQGPGSVAGALHYPKGAKIEKKQAAVQFYCEVGPEGRARHIRIIAEDPRGPFYGAVDKAVHQGQFIPAKANGKPVPVLMGGTVMFVNTNSGPAMVVSLSTAEKNKAGSGQNYIQPQLIMSYADLTRKTYMFANSTSFTGGGIPNAEISFNVNANGTIGSSKIVSEVPKNAGQILIKATEGAQFVPALANGKPVAGQFNLPIDFRMMDYQDQITGSHLGPRQE